MGPWLGLPANKIWPFYWSSSISDGPAGNLTWAGFSVLITKSSRIQLPFTPGQLLSATPGTEAGWNLCCFNGLQVGEGCNACPLQMPAMPGLRTAGDGSRSTCRQPQGSRAPMQQASPWSAFEAYLTAEAGRLGAVRPPETLWTNVSHSAMLASLNSLSSAESAAGEP